MNRILAIAAITLRSAIRSRVVVGLLVILLVTVIGLPLTIKGDGTVSGYMQVLLTYTLGLVSAILSLVTLWAGCAAISVEVAERQIHLVVTKPVRRAQIWAGKWVGLMILNAVLLAFTGATITGIVHWKQRGDDLSEADRTELETQILVARQKISPAFPDVSQEAREFLQQQQDSEALPADVSPSDVLAAIRQSILTQRHAAGPNETVTWIFPLPAVSADRPIHLRFRFSSSNQSSAQIAGRWRVGDPDNPHLFEQELFSTPEGFHTLVIPPEAVSADGSLQVEYTNRNQDPVVAVFSPNDGPDIFVYRGGFLGNLARALLIQFCHIAFLAALGVTAGALFSMPVASFIALFAMVLLYSVSYLETLASQPILANVIGRATPGIADRILSLMFRAMHSVLAPLQVQNPLELLGIGEMVTWSGVGWVFLIKIVVYSGVLGIAGNWLFNQRELGLPS